MLARWWGKERHNNQIEATADGGSGRQQYVSAVQQQRWTMVLEGGSDGQWCSIEVAMVWQGGSKRQQGMQELSCSGGQQMADGRQTAVSAVVDLAATDHCPLSLLMFSTAAACHHHPSAVVIPVVSLYVFPRVVVWQCTS
jgi:hypothetical protein